MKVSPTSAKPLDSVFISDIQADKLTIRDAWGRVVETLFPQDGAATYTVSGAPGTQLIFAEAPDGRPLAVLPLRVQVITEIDDETGRYRHLLEMLHDTMMDWWMGGQQAYPKTLRIDGKFYRYYVSWLRDHVHVLKGMKYYDNDLKTGIELYADSQREDGMIWDKCKQMLHSDLQNYRDYEFAHGDFIRKIPGNPKRRWQRIPVENDVEYLFIEGLYYTWKACGDDHWMTGLLDHALKAVGYSTSDRYRWSHKYGLLKRGYTIDTWDFQHDDDVKQTGLSRMQVDPDRTVFGVMFGDNTGMIASCRYLAEMLQVAGRESEAATMEQLAGQLQERLDKLAWNGRFYTHHVSEDPGFQRDVGGTDESAQVVQSNAYSLNRGLDHDKCTAIIDTYRQIRETMPETAPGEWYACYPPFEKGFSYHWHYMNGGTTSICAGELAHGAFEHGYETYASSILDRMLEWTDRLGGHLPSALKGKLDEPVHATFTPLNLRDVANISFHDHPGKNSLPWREESGNDMRHLPLGEQTREGVTFDLIDPATNEERSAIALSMKPPYQQEVCVSAGDRCASSVYFLHGLSGSGDPLGSIQVEYADGTHATQYIRPNQEIATWFMPAPNDPTIANKGKPSRRVWWQGPNGKFDNVGLHAYGWQNPHPDKPIRAIRLIKAETGGLWYVAGISLSNQGVYFPESPVSFGIPDSWGAAALVYALVEGLAGVVDQGVAFNRTRIAPRWLAAGTSRARVSVTYPASNGYAAYEYEARPGELRLKVAGSAEQTTAEILLPPEANVTEVHCNGASRQGQLFHVEGSRYLRMELTGIHSHEIVVTTEAN